MLDGYTLLPNGVIKQNKIFGALQKYDIKYVQERYDTYGDNNEKMAKLRFDVITRTIGRLPTDVLDIGYGNGSFLKYAGKFCKTYGSDISGYPVPDGCEFVSNIGEKKYDVVCLFDVLEHFDDPTALNNIKTNYLVVSLPWCHHRRYGDEWFKNWKHRRPDEHLWHFDNISLPAFVECFGYETIHLSCVEDEIRASLSTDSNILTAIFRKTQ